MNRVQFASAATMISLATCSPSAFAQQTQPAKAEPFLRAKTWFQTNVGYDPRLAIATDAVVVHRHGDNLDSLRQAIGSWKSRGYLVGRMFFADSDATLAYSKGRWDGKPHEDEIEQGPDGKPVLCGARPYLLPTEGWMRHLEEQAMIAIQAGADAILPEEPLAHTFSGYEAAFKPLFERRFNMPWQAESASPEVHFLTAQLKAERYHDLVQRLARLTKEQARLAGRDIAFVLPVHALYSNVVSQLVAPLAGAGDIQELDGYVGQVWTGPINWCSVNYGSTDKSFFSSAYALYDYFAALTAGTQRKLWLLADPVEDDPNHKWSEFQEWYRHSLAAKLMFPEVDAYEVMPWPDRVFLPGYGTGGGTPAPESFRVSLLSALQVLQEVPAQGEWLSPETGNRIQPTMGIGVAVADSTMWEPPKIPRLNDRYGLLLPVINQGIPVTASLAERWTEPGYLDRFRLIILTYEDCKPTSPNANVALADWVRNGGVLVLLGSGGEMKGNNFWWNRLGHSSAMDHLCAQLKTSLKEDANVQVGRGWVLRRQGSPGRFADASVATRDYLPLIERALAEARPADRLQRQGGFCLRRGPFIIAHALGQPITLAGKYVDVLDPELPVVDGIKLAAGTSGVFRDIQAALTGKDRRFTVLHCTHRLMEETRSANGCRLILRGPEETPGAIRLFTAGRHPEHVSATAMDGRPLKTDVALSENTIRIRFPNVPEGAVIEVRSDQP